MILSKKMDMEIDIDKIDTVVLALLHLPSYSNHGIFRAWRGHDWDALNRHNDKGMIGDPRNKGTSIIFSGEDQDVQVNCSLNCA